ncbi:MAG: hypothetical protein RDV48_22845 [Candidatus Eremiobacteraeota bacterium]|nr:hypothetical protein [Candidatus Eremiobacteraeota bacterium]
MIGALDSFISRLPLTMIFFACMMSGVAYSMIILLMGGGQSDSGDGGGGHHGILSDLLGGNGHHGDAGTADGGGADGGGADGGGHHAVHISFFSPLSITTFLTGFGSLGLISLHALQWNPLHSIFGSGLGAALLNIGVTFAIYKIFISTQASSTATTKELIGIEASVITAIPVTGVGEIAYTSPKHGRQTALARSMTRELIEKGETVVIMKFVGTAAIVKLADESGLGTKPLPAGEEKPAGEEGPEKK